MIVIPVYNDLKNVLELHQNLREYGVYSIWGDGRTGSQKKILDSNFSTDGTREYLSHQQDAILIDLENCSLKEKVLRLVKFTSNIGYEYVMVLFSDESVKGSFNDLVKNLHVLNNEQYKIHFSEDVNFTNSSNFEKIRKNQTRIYVSEKINVISKNHSNRCFVDGITICKRKTNPKIVLCHWNNI